MTVVCYTTMQAKCTWPQRTCHFYLNLFKFQISEGISSYETTTTTPTATSSPTTTTMLPSGSASKSVSVSAMSTPSSSTEFSSKASPPTGSAAASPSSIPWSSSSKNTVDYESSMFNWLRTYLKLNVHVEKFERQNVVINTQVSDGTFFTVRLNSKFNAACVR